MHQDLVIMAVFILIYSTVAGAVERTWISGAIIFTAFGLLIGLPLTILMGFGVAALIFKELSLFELALLATMLAPTDAALGKAVVTNETVPNAVRQGLNVKSGLNDGICVPILFVFLALATGKPVTRGPGSSP